MCGVIGLVYERTRDDLGQIAAELLRTLEYRGYDSTGAAIQGDGDDVVLAKGVGAPSVMVHDLGITRMRGRAFCGLGAGWWLREHQTFGLDFPPAAVRLAQLQTTILSLIHI